MSESGADNENEEFTEEFTEADQETNEEETAGGQLLSHDRQEKEILHVPEGMILKWKFEEILSSDIIYGIYSILPFLFCY